MRACPGDPTPASTFLTGTPGHAQEINMTDKILRELIEREEKKGRIVFMTVEGPMSADMEKFLKQPTEGILYDLNRDRVTVLHFLEQGDPRWVNDYAVGLVIGKLKEYYDIDRTGRKGK